MEEQPRSKANITTSEEKLIIKIDGKKYDLSDYVDKHPGGRKILERAAKMDDAGQTFRDIGHSQEALRLREMFRVIESVPEQTAVEEGTIAIEGDSQTSGTDKLSAIEGSATLLSEVTPKKRWIKQVAIVAISLLWAIIINVTSQSGAGFYNDFVLQYPAAGEAGHGRFAIRGASGRGMDYPWRLAQPRTDATILAWVLCVVHVALQWAVQYFASREKEANLKEKGIPKYSDKLNKWNFLMMGVNGLCILLGFIHKYFFYDGLANTISEAVAQNAVVFYLSVVLLMETPRRGVFMHWGKGYFRLSKEVQDSFYTFLKEYHGYLFSLAFTVNYHYQAIESTSSHFFGYFYQMLLILQGTLLFNYSHKDRSWTFWLESLVLLHAVGVAIIQNIASLCMFTFGFALVTLANQIWGLPFIERALFGSDNNNRMAHVVRIMVAIIWLVPVAICGAQGLFSPFASLFIPLGLFTVYAVVTLLFWVGYKIYHLCPCKGVFSNLFFGMYATTALVVAFIISVALLGGSAPGLHKFAAPQCGEMFFDNETSVVIAEPDACFI